MSQASTSDKPLRLWPGVVIVLLQLAGIYGPDALDLDNMAMFFGGMGALSIGTLLFLLWWLFFSRARWIDRLGGFALLIVVHIVAVMLAHPTAKMSAMLPGVVWLCAAFLVSLFAGKRLVTVGAVLVVSLGWTLVQTSGVDGRMGTDYSWRWSDTAEQRFMRSASSSAPAGSGGVPGEVALEAAWPGFRGAGRDNVLAGVTLPTDWQSNPPQEIWRRPVGPGWGSFALVGERLCTQEQRDENEAVVCYDAASGEPIWLHTYPARFWESMAGAGPRATPTYHDGRLYTLGATGMLNSLDLATGEPYWTRDVAADAGNEIADWGFASSPLIVDDTVVVHASGAPAGRAVVAYELPTGEPRWFGEASGHGYSSPHLTTIDGVRQIVMLTGQGAFGLVAETGELLWQHDWPMGGDGSRVVQPWILEGSDDVLIGTSFGLGTRRIDVSRDASGGWTVTERWTSRGLKPYYNDLVVHDGFAFGFDGHIMSAIDVETGERAWKGGRYGNGQVLLLPEQDLLLVLTERGELALVRATGERFEEIAKIEAIDGKTWNHPIVVDGVVYVRNGEEAAAYRIAAHGSDHQAVFPGARSHDEPRTVVGSQVHLLETTDRPLPMKWLETFLATTKRGTWPRFRNE